MLMYANNSVNFLLYCLSGSRFRKEAIRVFCGCIKKESNAPVILATVTKADVFTDVSVQSYSTHFINGTNNPATSESVHL